MEVVVKDSTQNMRQKLQDLLVAISWLIYQEHISGNQVLGFITKWMAGMAMGNLLHSQPKKLSN